MALGNLKDLTKLVKHDRVNLCRIHSVFYGWVWSVVDEEKFKTSIF